MIRESGITFESGISSYASWTTSIDYLVVAGGGGVADSPALSLLSASS